MYENLFSGTAFKNCTLKNRILFCSPVTGFAHEGRLTARLGHYYLERAKGGAGLIELEPGLEYQESQTDEWAELAEQIHAFGAKLMASLPSSGGNAALPVIRRAGFDGVAFWNGNAKAPLSLSGAELLTALHVSSKEQDSDCFLGVDYLVAHGRDGAACHARAPVAGYTHLPDPDGCEKLIQRGCADMVALSFQLVCDPFWPRKAELGIDSAIRRNGLLAEVDNQQSKRIRCALNPYLGQEGAYGEHSMPRVAQSKNMVVVGGGPAGMQAAITASKRGHDVLLWESQNELGGNLLTSNHRRAAQWLVSEMKRNRVDARVGIPVTAASIAALRPDLVIVAASGSMKKVLTASLLERRIPSLEVDDCDNSIGQAIRNGFHVAIGI